ncbi:MAG: serine--tRNA ligase [Hyphomicrobiaceae bacterium]
MHDIKAIRDNPTAFDAGLKRRGIDKEFSAKKILDLDEQRRAHVTKLQEAQARRNAASKEIGAAKKAKDDATAERLMAEVNALKDFLSSGEDEDKRLLALIEAELAVIPNLPRDDVPDGADEKANVEVRRVGTPTKFAFTNKPKQHFELGEALGMMDFESAAKVSGARFVFLKGQLARLERALGQFMLDIHTEEFGYTEVNPPLLVRDEAAHGTGNLPKFEDQLFATSRSASDFESYEEAIRKELAEVLDDLKSANDERTRLGQLQLNAAEYLRKITLDMKLRESELRRNYQGFIQTEARLWLIPTAEVSLTNLVREQILDEDALPKRFTACTPCFRSEAGAAGRDTRGMIRQHQFTKVELVSVTTPEKSIEEHERMTKCAETILERLGLPFRTMLLCTGDMGFASQKTYDIEVWLPGQDAYREISSCSVCGDFQARRMGARYRPKGSKDVRFVHTLNGSALAVGRTLVAVLENYQQADGSIAIPEALRPYMGGKDRIAKA